MNNKRQIITDILGNYWQKGDSMIITPPMFEQQDELSATDFRKALENGESIARFLPDHVSESQITALFKSDTVFNGDIK